jgi:hypothetical protein
MTAAVLPVPALPSINIILLNLGPINSFKYFLPLSVASNLDTPSTVCKYFYII